MARLFGNDYTRAQLEAQYAGLNDVFGITHLTRADGAGNGARIIQVETGGGLRVDILPDRCCDIGAVWCNGVPFYWSGPGGPVPATDVATNTPLYGLLQTCGFDHIRQPEIHEGRAYPLHGSMLHRPARILRASPEWTDDNCTFVIEAEVTQFSLDRGGIRLFRRISLDLGGRSLRLQDRVTVTAGTIPVMAMYHINLGFPTFGPASVLTLNDADISAGSIADDGITTRPTGDGRVCARLSGGPDGPAISVRYDGSALPVLQTLCDSRAGVGLFCIEPATHDRKSRTALGTDLTPSQRGDTHEFALALNFATALTATQT